jgi:hypothetical protein
MQANSESIGLLNELKVRNLDKPERMATKAQRHKEKNDYYKKTSCLRVLVAKIMFQINPSQT